MAHRIAASESKRSLRRKCTSVRTWRNCGAYPYSHSTILLLCVGIAVMISLLSVETEAAAPWTECRDVLSKFQCASFYSAGLCTTRKVLLESLCKKTCGLCSHCKNMLSDAKCKRLERHSACHSNHERMKIYCPETCGFCPKQCEDVYSNCDQLMLQGACTKNEQEMKANCSNTCRFCVATTNCDGVECPVGHRCRLSRTMQPVCVCHAQCQHSLLTGAVCGTNAKSYPSLCHLQREECRKGQAITVKNYGDCKRVFCKDSEREAKSGLCVAWKKYGACDIQKGVMTKYCRKTCGFCRQDQEPQLVCDTTKFGCCWDNTAKADAQGTNCRVCKDREHCRFFLYDCGSELNNVAMKKHCPLSCKYCSAEAS